MYAEPMRDQPRDAEMLRSLGRMLSGIEEEMQLHIPDRERLTDAELNTGEMSGAEHRRNKGWCTHRG